MENPNILWYILECDLGWYGKGCSLPCGRCRNQDTCNHVDGHCPGGCAPGWSGIYCNESKYVTYVHGISKFTRLSLQKYTALQNMNGSNSNQRG